MQQQQQHQHQQLQQQTVGVTKLRLTDLNTHLICVLCGGYLIDATTIVECLHSFCRSCIIKYLEGSSFCPLCECQIHKAKPYRNLKPDKALQDIVYKLVPGLFHSEMRRRREFYAKHPEYLRDATTPEGRGEGVERLIYSPDDSISLSLEYLDPEIVKDANGEIVPDYKTGSNKRYLQCPALVTISHLKKFLRYKYELTQDHVVELIHRRESLPDDYTLMDVAYIYTWKRSSPMRFFYRIYEKGSMSAVMKLSSIVGPTENTNGSSVSSCAEEDHNEHIEQPKAIPESYCASVEEGDEEKDLSQGKKEDVTKTTEESTTAPSTEEINPLQTSHHDNGSKDDTSVSSNKSAILSLISGSVTETLESPKSKVGKNALSAKISRLKSGHRSTSLGKKSPTAHLNVKQHQNMDEVLTSSVNVKDAAETIVENHSHLHSPEELAVTKENEEATSGNALEELAIVNSPSTTVKTSSTSTETPLSSTESTSNTPTADEVVSEIPSAVSCALSESESLRDATDSQSTSQKNPEESTENIAVVSSLSPKQVNESPGSTKESCSSCDNSDSGILVSPSSNLSETSSSAKSSPHRSEVVSPSNAIKECATLSQNNTLHSSSPTQNSTEQASLPLQNKVAETSSCLQGSTREGTSILENHSSELLEKGSNMKVKHMAENNSSAVSSEKTPADISSSVSQATAAIFSGTPQASTSKSLLCQESQSSATRASENSCMSNSNVLTPDETRKLSIEHSIDSKTMQVLKSECEIKNMYSTAPKPNHAPALKPSVKAASVQNKNILWKKLNTPKTSKNSMKQPRPHGKTRAELINRLNTTKKEVPKTTQPTIKADKQNLKNISTMANNMKISAATATSTAATTTATVTAVASAVKDGDKAQATRNILKNNQQILKKNDEILRTANSVFPYLKTQQKLGTPYQSFANLKRKQPTAETWQKKNCSTQSQVSEDKSGAKKRRIMTSKDNTAVSGSRSADTPMANKPLMPVASSSLTPETSNSSMEKKPSQAESHDPQSTKAQSSITPSAQASQLGKRGSPALEATSNTALSKPGVETQKRVKTESTHNADNADTAKNMFCINSNGLQIIPISRAQQESSIQNQSTSDAKKSPSETKTSPSMPNKSLTPLSESISVRPLNNKLYTKASVASKDKKLPNDSHIAALLNKSNSVNTEKQRTFNSVPAHTSTAFAQPSPSKAAPKVALPQKFTDNPSKSPRQPSQGTSPRDRQDITPPSLLSLLKQEKTSEESKGSRSSTKHDSFGALDLSASPRRAQHSTIVSIADTLARRQQLKCTSPPPLSPLSTLSPFPATPSLPVRSPPPSLRIPVPGLHQRAAPQQRPSSLSSSSPSPPAESPGSSRMAPPAQDIYMSPFLPLMLRQQLELQRMWNAASASSGKPLNPSTNDWYGEGSVKRLENLMKSFQQQQQPQGQQTKVGSANVPLFPYTNNRRAK